MKFISLGLFSLLFFLFSNALAQNPEALKIGAAKGTVKDSIEHHALRSATVSVYKRQDSSLVAYQLSGIQGEFRFNNLPVNTDLEVVISFIGYKHYRRNFLIASASDTFDFMTLYLSQQSIELKGVEIKSYKPPIQMKGDTLEFNADAFKTAKNAVVQDLLRKLPGVILWGDGLITVNGKAVKKVLVEGKPFFGGDAKIAIQNLPKESVDKIQVYKAGDDRTTKLDSSVNINIKLKNGWKSGLFGKISSGYGTDKRYVAGFAVSSFSPRTQITIASMANNSNIVVNDVLEMTREASFKATGVSLELQPDFFVEGLNKSKAAGFNFLHDFIADAAQNRNNRLENSYFVTQRDGDLVKNTITSINIKADSNLLQSYNETRTSSTLNQNFKNSYKLENDLLEFYFIPNFSQTRSQDFFNSKSVSISGDQTLQSASSSTLKENIFNKVLTFNTGFRSKTKNFQIGYSSFLNTSDNIKENKTSFASNDNLSQLTRFDRNYDIKRRRISNDLSLKLFKLERLFGGRDNVVDLTFVNNVNFSSDLNNSSVDDGDLSTNFRTKNSYLSNRSLYRFIDERPTIKLEKTIEKSLVNRFSRLWRFSLDINGQLYKQTHSSEKAFQVFDNAYLRFLPAFKLKHDRYNNFTKYKASYEVNYRSFAIYPDVNQRAPLVDSTNFYFRQFGNMDLLPSFGHELSLTFFLENFRKSNSTDNYFVKLGLNKINNAIGNNILYDNLGRAYGRYLNVDGNQSWFIQGEARKSIKVQSSTLQFILKPSLSNATQPNYINGLLNSTSLLSTDNNFVVSYLYKDAFQFELNQQMLISKLKQTNNPTAFKSSILSTRFIASLNISPAISFNTNITYNSNSSTYGGNYNFTLWNANLYYRFLKGNQGEVKLSALDILHQNKGVVNFGLDNTFTTGSVNVMQQYFLVSLAYYPRVFGRKAKKSSLSE